MILPREGTLLILPSNTASSAPLFLKAMPHFFTQSGNVNPSVFFLHLLSFPNSSLLYFVEL